MSTIESRFSIQEDLWAASRRAESEGDFFQALEIHKKILLQEGASYAASLRAGWLYYKSGLYEESLRHYERAGILSDDVWPLYGIMNCLAALGETEVLNDMEEKYGLQCKLFPGDSSGTAH